VKSALAFLVRRSLAGVLTLVVMITITFVVFWATPTQPATFVYPGSVFLSDYQIQHGDHLLGTDKPKLEQWASYETHLLRFDFGKRWGSNQVIANTKLVRFPIAPFVYPALRTTLSLLLGGAAMVLLLAVPLGAFAGSRIGSLSDRTISLVALVGVCTHPMVIGILVRSLFAGRLHWLPPTGYCPLLGSNGSCGGAVDWADHLILPWLTFALLFLALYVRMVRTSVADTLHEDFVRTARAKGASDLRVMSRHVLPNAALRILTMIGMEIGTAIGVSIYIETAYGIGGLASLAVRQMAGESNALDLPFILAIVFLISLIVIVGNLAVDAISVFIDPRVVLTRDRAPTAKAAAGGVI
jgi:peptide/nickel transport system permease protein